MALYFILRGVPSGHIKRTYKDARRNTNVIATLALATAPGNQANAANMKPADLVSFPNTHIAQVSDDIEPFDGGNGPILDGQTHP